MPSILNKQQVVVIDELRKKVHSVLDLVQNSGLEVSHLRYVIENSEAVGNAFHHPFTQSIRFGVINVFLSTNVRVGKAVIAAFDSAAASGSSGEFDSLVEKCQKLIKDSTDEIPSRLLIFKSDVCWQYIWHRFRLMGIEGLSEKENELITRYQGPSSEDLVQERVAYFDTLFPVKTPATVIFG